MVVLIFFLRVISCDVASSGGNFVFMLMIWLCLWRSSVPCFTVIELVSV